MAVKKFNISAMMPSTSFDFNTMNYEDSCSVIFDELHKTRKSFVKIGWYLKHINDNKLYCDGGYEDLYSFAADKFHISDATANRFINICEQYSVGGNSPDLDEQYLDFTVSQLFEMLPMSNDERKEISPTMPVKEIREIKNKKKLTEQKMPSDDEIRRFFEMKGFQQKSDLTPQKVKEYCVANFGKSYEGGGDHIFHYDCTPRGIEINGSFEITWLAFAKRALEIAEKQDQGIKQNMVPVHPATAPAYRELTQEEKDEYDDLVSNAEQMSIEDVGRTGSEALHGEVELSGTEVCYQCLDFLEQLTKFVKKYSVGQIKDKSDLQEAKKQAENIVLLIKKMQEEE